MTASTITARRTKSQAASRALIPDRFIDFPSQRLWAVAIFGLLQSLKIVDLIQLYWTSHPENYGGSLFKWWCLDLLYLFALWIVKIPWLQFSNTKTLVLVVLVLLVNPIIFAMPSAIVNGTIIQLLTGTF
jgi:nucleoporin POM152